MNDLNTIISILNFLGLGGLGFFLYYLIRGLRERIANLSTLAQEQKQTLDVVRERAIEIDKLSQHYKKAMTDFQDMGKILEDRRQELVKELEEANKRKDEQLAEFKKVEIQEIELKAESLKRIPELENELQKTVKELRSQIEIITPQESTKKQMTPSEKFMFTALTSLVINRLLQISLDKASGDIVRKKPNVFLNKQDNSYIHQTQD